MWEKHANALLAIILACILWGALAIQFLNHEVPCALCFLQRLGMIGVAAGALMNVKFAPRAMHYGFSLLAAIFGGSVAIRQISLHACPQFPTFGLPFWGLSLYTWSFLVFVASVLYIGLILMVFDHSDYHIKDSKPNWWGQLAFWMVSLVALTNIFASLWVCGLNAC
jgi:disulfide bond formation protein DsbB